jgi:hypothetical protein
MTDRDRGHDPGECECITCGYPCLRPDGHAEWCPSSREYPTTSEDDAS